jgi:hypothetical protein
VKQPDIRSRYVERTQFVHTAWTEKGASQADWNTIGDLSELGAETEIELHSRIVRV